MDTQLKFGVALTLVIGALIAFGALSPPGPPGPPLPISDKQLHFLAFALLVLPLGWLCPNRWRTLALTALAYGGLIEIVQPYFGRSAEWADLAADAGGIAATLLPAALRRRKPPEKSPRP